MENKRGPFSQDVVEAWYAKKGTSVPKSQHVIEDVPSPYPLPKPVMRLYGFRGFLMGEYFDTEKALIEHIMSNECSLCSLTALEYLGDFAGRSDVLSCIDRQGNVTIQRQVKTDIIEVFDREMSTLEGRPIWIGGYGNLRKEYDALKKRGVTLTQDVYAANDEIWEKFREAVAEVDAEIAVKGKGRTK